MGRPEPPAQGGRGTSGPVIPSSPALRRLRASTSKHSTSRHAETGTAERPWPKACHRSSIHSGKPSWLCPAQAADAHDLAEAL